MTDNSRAWNKLIRNAAGFADGLSSVQFARLMGVGIEVVARWRNGKEPAPDGWSFHDGKWHPFPEDDLTGSDYVQNHHPP
ncbi:hypothetical protein I8748_22885 [Nostoc sp. CENA67]|uniref:Uncharacterized protein n=1 Tax=Amazonocrinis nigriterrae CENA67 TaxID=2794033 RepID=A0A8J7HWQ9_9NOST|nr:hypothetical protein [Amazonocrinis nigriterrae]MBH8564993.1 hypothetical protein [Amazonocrinis nigriterrae CENA67]